MPFQCGGSTTPFEDSMIGGGDATNEMKAQGFEAISVTALEHAIPPTIKPRPAVVAPNITKEKSDEATTATPATTKTATNVSKEHFSAFKIMFSKLRLLKALWDVDKVAAYIVFGGVIANAFSNCWNLIFECHALTLFQKAIMNDSLEANSVLPIVLLRVGFEILDQVLCYLNHYARKRLKKKMEQHLTELLIQAEGHLPYHLRIDSYIQMRYDQAGWLCAAWETHLRGICALMGCLLELMLNIFFVVHFLVFEAESRTLVVVALLLFSVMTSLRLISKTMNHKGATKRERIAMKGHDYRRAHVMSGGFHQDKAACRDSILFDILPWQLREYRKAMKKRISRPGKSTLRKIFRSDSICESLCNITERVGFSSVVMYFGKHISLGNFNIMERRILSLCLATSSIAALVDGTDEWNLMLARFFEVVDLGNEQRKIAEKKVYTASLRDGPLDPAGFQVELRNVSFAYPEASAEDSKPSINPSGTKITSYALRNFSFTFERGKIYSIVGHTGAGKTTLVQLLSRLFSPTSGTITINGRNILDYDPKDIQSNISVQFQDFSRFPSLTARENIEIGNLDDPLRDRLAESVAADTNITSFVSLDSVLTDLSTQGKDPGETWQSDLSGGQWQKIGLARTFMRNAAGLMIFDEPTSALDIEAEHAFFRQIRARRKGKTTIFITHKYNTTKTADCILFVKHGRVLEWGSHEELMKFNGEYARLYRMQSAGFNPHIE